MCYTYDSLSRVTARTVKKLSDNSVVSTETFNYDAAGNVTADPDSSFQYMTANSAENLTLESMARRAMLSESHFSRLFKSTTSIGFKEYLNMLRVREAQRLLLNTSASVCEIAFSCGFNDSNYFSNSFKKITGITPLEYRKLKRKEQ